VASGGGRGRGRLWSAFCREKGLGVAGNRCVSSCGGQTGSESTSASGIGMVMVAEVYFEQLTVDPTHQKTPSTTQRHKRNHSFGKLNNTPSFDGDYSDP
jgi:hypothetical protein